MEHYEKYVWETNKIIKHNQNNQYKSSLIVIIFSFLIQYLIIGFDKLMLLLIISILILNTLSFYLCKEGNKKDIDSAFEYYVNGKEEFFNKDSSFTKLGNICNNLSLLFTIGLLIVDIIELFNYL